jgi:polysaccharide export outer membrane protein
LADDSISGTFVVRPDGSVVLGGWGSVSVAGRTPDEAGERIRDYLAKARGGESGAGDLRVTVQVKDRGSKRYYVIVTGPTGGEQAYAFPLTGAETVLDAVAGVPGLSGKTSQLSVQVIRKPLSGKGTVLRVDWPAITQKGDVATNYPLQPDDKVYVTCEE